MGIFSSKVIRCVECEKLDIEPEYFTKKNNKSS